MAPDRRSRSRPQPMPRTATETRSVRTWILACGTSNTNIQCLDPDCDGASGDRDTPISRGESARDHSPTMFEAIPLVLFFKICPNSRYSLGSRSLHTLVGWESEVVVFFYH